jgi:type III restriction enzyme
MSDPYAVPTTRRSSLAPLVPAIRHEVDSWRRNGYPGVSTTTRRLLEYWFLDEHESEPGVPFRYYFAQREAVESAIYLYEVARLRSPQALGAHFDAAIAATTDFPRFVIKMATGSGKTKVMSLLVAWAYMHATREANSELPKTFLLIAPNIIVYERLREDFAHGRIFRNDPVVPPEWADGFDLVVILKGEPVPPGAAGVLALANIQALYERRLVEPTNPVEAILGPKPPARLDAPPPLLPQIAARGSLMVLNDEAHHLHDEVKADTGEKLVAWQTINRLNLTSGGVALQLDVSATPRNQQGQLFGEIIADYPLAQAIEDGIVKRPIIGELGGAVEQPSDDASVRYRPQLAAGVAKWREYRDVWAPTGRTPLMFVMAENTKSADQITGYLETLQDLAGRVLTIHVNREGEIAKADMDRARDAVRRVDEPASPYVAIVSVLMLREGWDVRNVSVIVPLRAYTAKAQILPEQTLGRGLRRVTPPGSGVDERLVVIEHEAFRSLWDQACKQEGLELEFQPADQVLVESIVIAVEPERMSHDIEIPQLPRVLSRSTSRLGELRLDDIPARKLRLAGVLREESVDYTGRDLLSGEVVERATYPYPVGGGRDEVLAWYVNAIQRDARLTGQFHILAPLLHDWIELKAFGGHVDFGDPLVLQTLGEAPIQEQVLAVFRHALDEYTLTSRPASAGEVKALRLSSTRPFLWSGQTATADHSIFSAQPCDSGLEIRMVGFLDRCEDVDSFAKLAREVRFSLEYRNEDGRLAYYYPDFVVRMVDGTHLVVETKGRTDLDVPRKDTRARRWASEATEATGTRWQYHRVDEDVFDQYVPRMASFGALLDVIGARAREAVLASLPTSRLRTREELVAIMDRALAESGEVTGIDETIRRFREDPRAG